MEYLYHHRLKVPTIHAAEHQLGYPPFSSLHPAPHSFCEEPLYGFVQIPSSSMLSLD